MADRSSYVRLLSQIRKEFEHLRWNSEPVRAQITHRATNAEAEGVEGVPFSEQEFVAIESAGNRRPEQRMDGKGNQKFREDAIVDVEGEPIVNSAGQAYDVVMPAFRMVEFFGRSQDFTKLREVAERAGRLVARLPQLSGVARFQGWSFSKPSDLWWSLLFEIAWDGEHPFLHAVRQLWLPGQPNTRVPYDLHQINAFAQTPFLGMNSRIPSNWLKRLPDAWVSQLDNAIIASLDVSDHLLSQLETGPTEHDADASSIATENDDQVAKTTNRRRFAVALSFPGEHRELVEPVAFALERAFGRERIFYDGFHKAELAAPNLDLRFQHIYRDESDLIVVWACREYSEKEWCGLEWCAIRDLMKDSTRPDTDIMILRLDDEPVRGLLSIHGHLDVSKMNAREVADAIIWRWTAPR